MKHIITQFLKNQERSDGFTAKEIKEQCELSASIQDIKAIMTELKQNVQVVSQGTRYFLVDNHPDLLPKLQAAKLLALKLTELKQESSNQYPLTLGEFCIWLQNETSLKTSEIQSWIGKSDKAVLLVFDPKRNDRVLLLKSDIDLLLNAGLIESAAVEILNNIKDNDLQNYPCKLTNFKKSLIDRVKQQIPGISISAKTLEPYLKSPTGFCMISVGRSKSVCLPEDKPKEVKEYLTITFIEQCAVTTLNNFLNKNLSKYPCTKSDFKKALLKEINQRLPQGSIQAKELDPYIPQQSSAFKFIKSGRSEKVCLSGHEMLIKPPTGAELKKLLLELINLRTKGSTTIPIDEEPPIDISQLENMFWQEHNRLDEIGFRDRAVPIPKLWKAMKNRIKREQFELILQTLSKKRDIQLERRTTMDGLSQEEKDACYQVDDFLFYIARRL